VRAKATHALWALARGHPAHQRALAALPGCRDVLAQAAAQEGPLSASAFLLKVVERPQSDVSLAVKALSARVEGQLLHALAQLSAPSPSL
jgi:hypothetical protein